MEIVSKHSMTNDPPPSILNNLQSCDVVLVFLLYCGQGSDCSKCPLKVEMKEVYLATNQGKVHSHTTVEFNKVKY